MNGIRSGLNDYLDATRSFSRPARLLLLTELLAWASHGIFYVLYNLYLVEAGYTESFVGRTISIYSVGLAAAAIPAGWLADRWGRRRTVILGAVLSGIGLLVRSVVLEPSAVYAGSLIAGAGQSLLMIAAAPFMAEFSTERERTHLFGAFFATGLVAGVLGSLLGGWLPAALQALAEPLRPDRLHAFRYTLFCGAALSIAALAPMLRLRGLVEASHHAEAGTHDRAALRPLIPIGVNAFLIGAGAGLIIPFMNLYFAKRFASTAGEIGLFFSTAQILTAIASLLTPIIARRFGKLRTAVAAELLSLPFLVTLGFESQLSIALVAFWFRAVLMQSSTPLLQTFVMETLRPSLRARSMSLNNLLWHVGWAISATVSGILIEAFGFAMPFYLTAFLYAAGAAYFYLSFRGTPEGGHPIRLSEEAKGLRGEGPITE